MDEETRDTGIESIEENVTDNISDKNNATSATVQVPDTLPEGCGMFTFDPSQTYQEVTGFGAAYTWYSEWLFWCNDQEGALDKLFKDAKLTVLRFKNEYEYYGQDSANNTYTMKRYYDAAKTRASEYNEEPTVLLSCWSPPSSLKEGNDRTGAASLKKDESGNYCYEEYADWWAESIEYYESQGIPIDYICIQNEVDFAADYDGCRFEAEETDTIASYAKAHIAVYQALKERFGEAAPKILGPETMSCEPRTIDRYMKEVMKMAPDSMEGIAHHLYVGGNTDSEKNKVQPDSFNLNFMELYDKYQDCERWQTEFYVGHGIDTATLINNCLLYEKANTYLYWSGVWEELDPGNLETGMLMACTRGRENWLNDTGWRLCADYYAIRHFSEYIRPGYLGIKSETKDRMVRCSAFISKDSSKAAVVLINTGDEEKRFYMNPIGYQITESNLYQSVFGDTCTSEETLYQSLGSIDESGIVVLPAKSVTTIDISGSIAE